RCPARVRLGATPAAARTNTPAELHNRMPQFAGGPVAFPSPTSEHDRAAEAGSPPDSEKGREIAARAELELRARSDCDVVCHPHASSHLPSEFLDKRVRIRPAVCQIRVESHGAGRGVDSAG